MENVGTWEREGEADGFAERLLGPYAESLSLGVLRTLSGSALACIFGFTCTPAIVARVDDHIFRDAASYVDVDVDARDQVPGPSLRRT